MISTLYTVGTLAGSFALPFVGRQIDRRGVRMVTTVISVLLGLACIYMNFVRNAVMLAIGFVALRMFGQGSLTLACQTVINRWWVRRRGTMMGIANLVSMPAMGLFPGIVNGLILSMGWRSTYVLLGLIVMGVMVPTSLIFFRQQPEDYGLRPDGSASQEENGQALAEDPPEVHWTVSEAVRTPAYWIIVLGLAALGGLSTGLFFHMVSIVRDNGLSADVAAAIFLPTALTGSLVALASGILIDRIPARFLLAGALFLQACSLIMAQSLSGSEMALLYGVILGATNGLQMAVSGVVMAKYFGRRHLGSINGVGSTIMIAGSALGPMPFGIARDLLGSYNLVLSIAAVLPLVLGVASLFTRQPHKHQENCSPG